MNTTVKNGSYVQIQSFMVNDLHLSGNELIVYAIIYGFSQDGSSWFTGSRKYIANWCQTSEKSVTNNLKKLLSKGLIRKRSNVEHGCVFNDYQAIHPASTPGKKVPLTGEESSLGTGEESSPHILEDINTSEEDRVAKPKSRRTMPPTLDEAKAYASEMGYHIDVERFFDYYAANGWTQGKGKPIKDWRAAMRNWNRRESEFHPEKESTGDFSKYDDFMFGKGSQANGDAQ